MHDRIVTPTVPPPCCPPPIVSASAYSPFKATLQLFLGATRLARRREMFGAHCDVKWLACGHITRDRCRKNPSADMPENRSALAWSSFQNLTLPSSTECWARGGAAGGFWNNPRASRRSASSIFGRVTVDASPMWLCRRFSSDR